MGVDEEETLRRLREYQDVIGRSIEEHRGRLFEGMTQFFLRISHPSQRLPPPSAVHE